MFPAFSLAGGCTHSVHVLVVSKASRNPNCRKLRDLTIVCVNLETNISSPHIRNSLLYCACVLSFLMQNLAWAFGYVMST